MEQVKLLMTELSPELTRLCAETLAAQDIAVTVCEKDGAKALAALSAEKPDAVLLDAFMPGLDALTVKQRYDEAGGGKTVFFVTGSFTDDALESEMMKKGFSFYFQKPFDPEVLAARARGGGPPCGCTACGGRRVHRDGDPAPDRRACAHQGLPVPAGRHPDDNGKPGLYQQRYKAPVSGDRKAQRHHGQPCGAGHPPRH